MINRMSLPVWVLLGGLASSAMAEETYSAKSLFFGTSGDVIAVSTAAPDPTLAQAGTKTKPTLKKTQMAAAQRPTINGPIGARYYIRLLASDGQVSEVPTTRVFHSGEKFQVGVEVNGPTYIYVWNEESNGHKAMLFPAAGQENFVNVKGRVTVPSRGSFQFDHVPGEEKMTILLSRRPLEEGAAKVAAAQPDFIQGGARMQNATDRCGAGSGLGGVSVSVVQVAAAEPMAVPKGIVMNPTATEAACAGIQTYAAKGIVFSEDAASEMRPANYVVKADPGIHDTLTLQIRLQHQ